VRGGGFCRTGRSIPLRRSQDKNLPYLALNTSIARMRVSAESPTEVKTSSSRCSFTAKARKCNLPAAERADLAADPHPERAAQARIPTLMNDPKRKPDRPEVDPVVPDDEDAGSATAMFRRPPGVAPADAAASGWTDLENARPAHGMLPTQPPPTEAPVQSNPVRSAGEFTRFFEAITPVEPAPTHPKVSEPTENSTPNTESASQGPGDFTRIFLQVPAPPVETPRPIENMAERTSAAPLQAPPAAEAGPGEFTRFISGRERMPPESSPVHPEPGLPASPAARKLKGFSTPGASGFASAGPSGITESFHTPRSVPEASPPDGFEDDRVVSTPFRRSPDTAEQRIPFSSRPEERPGQRPGEAGEFTRLMKSLSDTASRPMHEGSGPLTGPTPTAGAATSPEFLAGPGEFTRLMKGLSGGAPPEAAALPGFERADPPPPPKSVPQGAGDYTRIISGSLLRQAQPAQPQPAPVTTGAASGPLSGFPPPVPHLPTPPLPVAPPKGKLERYLPLLLILNAFLLAVLILLVAFSLRGR
jgi:hypothetical protein